jgi:hypothetical protein
MIMPIALNRVVGTAIVAVFISMIVSMFIAMIVGAHRAVLVRPVLCTHQRRGQPAYRKRGQSQ